MGISLLALFLILSCMMDGIESREMTKRTSDEVKSYNPYWCDGDLECQITCRKLKCKRTFCLNTKCQCEAAPIGIQLILPCTGVNPPPQ
ncbi:hypothetical protein M5689_024006 [Euphorbia peplus]|nr:hypothetical protein M5689_024006 [Euphorbia peplus]